MFGHQFFTDRRWSLSATAAVFLIAVAAAIGILATWDLSKGTAPGGPVLLEDVVSACTFLAFLFSVRAFVPRLHAMKVALWGTCWYLATGLAMFGVVHAGGHPATFGQTLVLWPALVFFDGLAALTHAPIPDAAPPLLAAVR